MRIPRFFPARALLPFWHVHPATVCVWGGHSQRGCISVHGHCRKVVNFEDTWLQGRLVVCPGEGGVVSCWRVSGFLQLLDEEVYTGAISLSKLVGHNRVTRPGQRPDL